MHRTTFSLLAGELFGFHGSVVLGDIEAPAGSATLEFAVAPIRVRQPRVPFGFAPFTMTGHLRAFSDDGALLSETDLSGRGTTSLFGGLMQLDNITFEF